MGEIQIYDIKKRKKIRVLRVAKKIINLSTLEIRI